MFLEPTINWKDLHGRNLTCTSLKDSLLINTSNMGGVHKFKRGRMLCPAELSFEDFPADVFVYNSAETAADTPESCCSKLTALRQISQS